MDNLIFNGGKINDITVCHLPHQPAPFVHGWVENEDGKHDVWLRNDGMWTTEELDERTDLILSKGWEPPCKRLKKMLRYISLKLIGD